MCWSDVHFLHWWDGTSLEKSRSSGRPIPLGDASVDARGGVLEVQAATAPAPGARSKVRWRMVQCVTRVVVDDVETERRPVAGAWSRHRRNDVALGANVGCFRPRCGGSALCVGRKLSPRAGAIIRKPQQHTETETEKEDREREREEKMKEKTREKRKRRREKMKDKNPWCR